MPNDGQEIALRHITDHDNLPKYCPGAKRDWQLVDFENPEIERAVLRHFTREQVEFAMNDIRTRLLAGAELPYEQGYQDAATGKYLWIMNYNNPDVIARKGGRTPVRIEAHTKRLRCVSSRRT